MVVGVCESPLLFPSGRGGVDGSLRQDLDLDLERDFVNEEEAPNSDRRPVGGRTNLQDVEFERQCLQGPGWDFVLREQRAPMVRHCWQAVYMRCAVTVVGAGAGAGFWVCSSSSSVVAVAVVDTTLPSRLGCKVKVES